MGRRQTLHDTGNHGTYEPLWKYSSGNRRRM